MGNFNKLQGGRHIHITVAAWKIGKGLPKKRDVLTVTSSNRMIGNMNPVNIARPQCGEDVHKEEMKLY